MWSKFRLACMVAMAIGTSAVRPDIVGAQNLPYFNCPEKIPVAPYFTLWIPPWFSVQKEFGAGSILFKPTKYEKIGDIVPFSIGVSSYVPDPRTGWQSPDWYWMDAVTWWTCKGDYPNGAWLINVHRHEGKASLFWGEDEDPNEIEGEPGSGGPSAGDDGGGGTITLVPYTQPSGFECWAWVWSTYTNGVLVSEEVAWVVCWAI